MPTVSREPVNLGFEARPWQADCFLGFQRFSVVVVHRRGGKTVMAVMRLIDAALRNVHERGRYAYIAPQLKQAKGLAWDYLKAYARKVPGTQINESELWVEFPNTARIRIFGADNPDSLRGFYFDGVVIDEVAQTKLDLWEQVLRPALSDRNGWVLFIGTPKGVNVFSKLYYEALGNPEWFAAKYNCHQTGALSDAELDSNKRTMSESAWRQEYLCDFTASSENNLISITDVLAAAGKHLHETRYNFAPKILAADVAWQGGDRSVLVARQGLAMFPPRIERGIPEKTFAGIIADAIQTFKPDAVFVDTTGGYGGEVVSRLRDLGHAVQEVVFSWKASSDRFLNIRAEMWFKMADWLKSGAAIPAEQYAPGLQAELCAPTYSNDNAANRLVLESKDDIRERLGFSPDIADALAMTFAFPVANLEPGAKPHQALTDFDPYREG